MYNLRRQGRSNQRKERFGIFCTLHEMLSLKAFLSSDKCKTNDLQLPFLTYDGWRTVRMYMWRNFQGPQIHVFRHGSAHCSSQRSQQLVSGVRSRISWDSREPTEYAHIPVTDYGVYATSDYASKFRVGPHELRKLYSLVDAKRGQTSRRD
ncbi:hypothetical protein VTK73DRAFT_8949 [Phialemonium thermophilum]|uniref:Uncharacterized protein n=1 Tax=Phialemonium thermophilum TaxID=223376 RepID=A0ABR3Y509_9PEZI